MGKNCAAPFEWVPTFELEAHYLNGDLARLWLVEFNEEHALEFTEQRLAIDDRNDFRCAKNHVLAVSVAIWAFIGAHAYGA